MAKQSNDKRFIKGLFKDTAPIDQPEGTWRYAKNAIINEIKGAISNEGGNVENGQLYPSGFVISIDVIGAIEVDEDRVVLFSYNNTNTYSEIGIWQNGVYTRLYFDTLPVNTQGIKGLNFNVSYPIEGTYNINPKGELIVYWTDDFNPPRALNVTLQQSTSASPGSTADLYGIFSFNSHDNHIDLLDLFPNSGPVPHVELDEVINDYQKAIVEGGGLLTGVYYLS